MLQLYPTWLFALLIDVFWGQGFKIPYKALCPDAEAAGLRLLLSSLSALLVKEAPEARKANRHIMLNTVLWKKVRYPLSRNYCDHNFLRINLRNFWGILHSQNLRERLFSRLSFPATEPPGPRTPEGLQKGFQGSLKGFLRVLEGF